MNYWSHVLKAAGLNGQYVWVLLGLTMLTFMLGVLAPDARPRLRNALLLLMLSFSGMLLAGALYREPEAESLAGYRWVHFFGQLLFWIAALNIASVILFQLILRKVGVSPVPILRDTLQGMAYVVVAISLLSHSGVDLTEVVATSAVVTAIIGFSLQDTLGNVMGGVALQMERSIGVGDWIRLGDTEGLVREIRWRQTSVETRNWDTLVIPNAVLMKAQVLVLGRRKGKPRLHRTFVNFNIDFRYSPSEVIDTIQKSLQAEPIANVATEPKPECLLMEFKDSYAVYAVRYWLNDFAKDATTSSNVRTRIHSSLLRANIHMSIPAQSVFLTMESESRAKHKQEQELSRRADAMKHIRVLAPLTEGERAQLAAQLTPAPFVAGEVITQQGNEAHYLYVIARGKVEVRLAAAGQTRILATLEAGDVFGEMGLLTGEPRHATVLALTETLCYRLDKAAFTDVLQRRPEVAHAISHLLAERKVGLEAGAQGLDAEAMKSKLAETQGDLLQRIRRFFTLS